MTGLHHFEGCIAGSAFASGDTVVVGLWRSSPFGPFVDVMWVRPGRRRVLLTSRAPVLDYIARLYAFDRAELVPVTGGWDGGAVAVEAGPLRIRLLVGGRNWRSWLFAARPRRLRRSPTWIGLEDALARPLVGRLLGGATGVRAVGVAPGGQREWYGVDDYRPIVSGHLDVDGADAGPLTAVPPDLDVGFSPFPRVPALVHLGAIVEPLDEELAEGAATAVVGP